MQKKGTEAKAEARKKVVGELIKKQRDDKFLTQEELAEKVGVTRATVSQWEKGKYSPRARFLTPLAEALGLTTADLMPYADSEVSPGMTQQKPIGDMKISDLSQETIERGRDFVNKLLYGGQHKEE